MSTTLSTEELLQPTGGKKRSIPGKGFKAKVDGKWQDYAPHCNRFLLQAYAAGCPSMRLNVRGHMYKFDFEKMMQKNLSTLEVCEMRAPHDAERPTRSALFKLENFRHPRSKGCKALRGKVRPQRPVFVVRVPAGGPGKTIPVPHPKKLGVAMLIAVPAEAEVGQPLFVPMPRTGVKEKVKYGVGGTLVGTTGTAVGVAIGEATAAGGLAGGALASAGGVVACSLGGVAVVGAVVLAAGAGVHYATHNPGKAVAIGALTIGGLVLVDHISEVGVLEGGADVVEGAGDVVESAGDWFAGDFGDGASDMGEAFLDGAEWLTDVSKDGVDIIFDLF